MIKLNVWGGAGEHGRSAYLLSGSTQRLLLDCGVKKGGAGEYPLLDKNIIPQLDAVLLSHAHEDHSVAIPLLYNLGYQGEVWTTRETREQLDTYFKAWRNNTERAGYAVPYEESDVQSIRYRYLEQEAARGVWFELISGVWAIWGRTGHLAGSVWFAIEMEDQRIFYSGDYTSESMLLQEDDPLETLRGAGRLHSSLRSKSMRSRVDHTAFRSNIAVGQEAEFVGVQRGNVSTATPFGEMEQPAVSSLAHEPVAMDDKRSMNWRSAPAPKAAEAIAPSESRILPVQSMQPWGEMLDLAIMDAAYGTDRDTQADKLQQLDHAIRETIARDGKVLLPMPVVGRGQEIMLWAEQQYPGIPLFVEQGLMKGMKQLLHSPYWLRENESSNKGLLTEAIMECLNGSRWQTPVTQDEREQWLKRNTASLWFIPDGMMQSALARWYYSQLAGDENNMVLLTGHVSEGTYADQLSQAPEEHGKCEVRKVRYKVHQGWLDVERMIRRLPARHTILVHTNREETDKLRDHLLSEDMLSEARLSEAEGAMPGQMIHSLSPGDELVV
ncbi:MBL fold metallo-hydrolase [Paenibacillus tundrae]|uniref:Cft2 family RNA processing exonuclease n=1 Tax=Paenibacillus tundrae TaxID=528187 RepID=A0ABT9WFX8_9BACL|nr:MBL fold metallo-hydrolase [Paenibacillus tundrae]MDQ0172168.1 Cft2 family RNA processing exonuclease [Paenibacillus tundrae]